MVFNIKKYVKKTIKDMKLVLSDLTVDDIVEEILIKFVFLKIYKDDVIEVVENIIDTS